MLEVQLSQSDTHGAAQMRGESTRPGARVEVAAVVKLPEKQAESKSADAGVKTAVGVEEELKRVIPVIAEVKKKHPAAIVSVDTYKATVARAAFAAGAEI